MRAVKEFDTVDGKRYRVRFRRGGTESSQTFRAKKDAQTFAALLTADDGVTVALEWLKLRETGTASLTFGQWFEQWVTELTGVGPRTRNDYRSMHRRYLTGLDGLPLPLITRSHVAKVVNQLADDGKSLKTTKNTVHMLSSCFAIAVEDGLIARNPCLRVKLPKQEAKPHRVRFLTYEEFGSLVDAMPEHYRPLVVLLVGTGLRWSEATALQSRHVNLASGTVTVEQAWKRVPGQGFTIGPPKSPKANRTVNAATMALAAVAPLLGKPDDWVFTTPNGNVVRHANFYNRIWLPAIEKAGLPNASPHDLRHAHASWLISDGQSLEAIQDQLGHESILTTRKVYGHLLPALGVAVGQSASRALARALQGSHSMPVLAAPIEPIESVQAPDQGMGA
jgi:integrase